MGNLTYISTKASVFPLWELDDENYVEFPCLPRLPGSSGITNSVSLAEDIFTRVLYFVFSVPQFFVPHIQQIKPLGRIKQYK